MLEKSSDNNRLSNIDFLTNKNIYSNLPLSVHTVSNIIFFTFSYVIFKRNSHYFKFNMHYYSKYWGIFLISNTIFFFSTGLLLIGRDFILKYQKNLRKFYKIEDLD
jgi:hypothetical protein